MSSRSFDNVKSMLVSVRNTTTVDDKMTAYDTWAENYDQDVEILGYNGSRVAAEMVSSHFCGDRDAAAVLDVACGTGLLAEHMKACGFKKFVGIDGSKEMLEEARKKGLYHELKQCVIGEHQLPVSQDSFDMVVICGSLSVDHVPFCVVKDLWSVCKPGGFVFMTCRHGQDNMEYKASLERELKEMEEKGLWSCVEALEVKKWARGVVESEQSYISGSVYLYQKKHKVEVKMQRTLEDVKKVVGLVHESSSVGDKMEFYNSWADTYDQDVAILEFHSPKGAANSIATHFPGDRAEALVLDVACGTGAVAKNLKACGFGRFVGIDGSPGMLEHSKSTGLYQELKLCLLGKEPLPLANDSFDVAVIAGALSVGHVPFNTIRELCRVCKPGGFVCMTTRAGEDNQEYKANLEAEMKKMEEEKLWVKVDVTMVDNWEKATVNDGYESGSVYLYKKC